MNNEKIENLLNLSLNATTEERDKSLDLNVGYDNEEDTWELIVKYNGDISKLNSTDIQVETLSNGYGIVTIKESLIEIFGQQDQIEYIEKPKRLFYKGNRL